MPSIEAASNFLTTLNALHPSIVFTMEVQTDGRIPFIGMDIIKIGTTIQTNTGLLLHFHSHTDKRYKHSLLKTMVNRAHVISSTIEIFNEECARLRSIFCRLDYPIGLINSTIRSVASKLSTNTVNLNQVNETATIRISLPYKEQRAADTVRKQMRDLSNKIGLSIQPVLISRKLEQDLKLKETKPSIVNK
jgi:hypothetical protein